MVSGSTGIRGFLGDVSLLPETTPSQVLLLGGLRGRRHLDRCSRGLRLLLGWRVGSRVCLAWSRVLDVLLRIVLERLLARLAAEPIGLAFQHGRLDDRNRIENRSAHKVYIVDGQRH